MKNFTVNTITWHKQTPKNMQTYYDVRSFFSLYWGKTLFVGVCWWGTTPKSFSLLSFGSWFILLFFSWWNTDTEKRKWAKEISGLFGNLKLCEKNYVWSAFWFGLVLRRAVWWLLTWLKEIKREFSALVISFDCCCAEKKLNATTWPFFPDTMEIIIKSFVDWLRVISRDKTYNKNIWQPQKSEIAQSTCSVN